MEGVLYVALLAAGFGAMWWQRARLSRQIDLNRIQLDDDAEVALHLARHEAQTRERHMIPRDILFALVEDAGIAETIRRAGGDVDALEDGLLLAGDDEDRRVPPEAALRVLAWAVYMARRADRPATCADLFAGLVQTARPTADLIEASGVSAADVLYAVIHGVAEGEEEMPDRGHVEVVLMNDDITTQEIVVEILRDVFELDDEVATNRMLEVHQQGKGIVGRYPAAEARVRLEAARRLARSRGFPLRLCAQPA